MTQNENIKKHLLKGGSLTALTALKKYGVFRLAARIANLKDSGMNVKTKMITVNQKRIAQYSL